MRDICFRGKRTDTGLTVYGYYMMLESTEPLHIIVDHEGTYHRVDPETVGQYSGMYLMSDLPGGDTSCRFIYEGDIVEYNDGVSKFRGKIVFENGAFGIATEQQIPIQLPNACYNDNFISLWELYWNQDSHDYGLECLKVIEGEPLDGQINGQISLEV